MNGYIEHLLIIFLVLILCALSFSRNSDWTSGLALWADVVHKSPLKARAHTNYGIALNKAGEVDRAVEEFSASIAIDPEYLFPYAPLATIYGMRGELSRAIAMLRWVLSFPSERDDYKAHTSLGVALMMSGDKAEARREFVMALSINPDYELARKNLEALPSFVP
jgi:Flp pilus assembly protein TadD